MHKTDKTIVCVKKISVLIVTMKLALLATLLSTAAAFAPAPTGMSLEFILLPMVI